jgi:hypothetical protein
MVTIIIISNDPHVMHLKERFQPLIKGQICIYSDFEQGLMAVFDKRPASVFIQREIDGTAAEVIARQIKGLLRDGSPRIILMGSLAGNSNESLKCFDDSFDFAATEEELSEFFGEQLAKIPYLLWKDGRGPAEWHAAPSEHHDPGQVQLVTVSDPSAVPDPFILNQTDNLHDFEVTAKEEGKAFSGPADPVVDHPSGADGHGASLSRPSKAKPATTRGVQGTNSSLGHVYEKQPKSRSTQMVFAGAEDRGFKLERDNANNDFSSFGWGGLSLTPKTWLYLVGFIIVVLLASVLTVTDTVPLLKELFNKKPIAGNPQSAKQEIPALQPQRSTVRQERMTSLPGIITAAGKDSQYSAGHPGWERYVADGQEFLVFRSANKIKAIQLIASRDHDIKSATISRLLQELLGNSSYSITGTSEKNGYLLGNAKLSEGADLVIYRKKTDALIRGVVVTLP